MPVFTVYSGRTAQYQKEEGGEVIEIPPEIVLRLCRRMNEDDPDELMKVENRVGSLEEERN